MSLIEQWAPYGDFPPLHFHRTEDELFYVLEGELRVWVQQEERQLQVGQTLLVQKGSPTPTASSPRQKHTGWS